MVAKLINLGGINERSGDYLGFFTKKCVSLQNNTTIKITKYWQ